MNKRHLVRWLLRPLGEPAFLRLYLESDDVLPRRLFEQVFWDLPADGEHPSQERQHAWGKLREWLLPEKRVPPIDWFLRIVHHLRQAAELKDDIADLARFWAAPELFPWQHIGEMDVVQEAVSKSGFYETHCHVRAAVPYEHLWKCWLENERWRASLRKHRCDVGRWKRTWAELVQEASKNGETMRRTWFAWSQREPSANEKLRWTIRLVYPASDRLAPHDSVRWAAGRYLAIYTALRCHVLYQRGQAGLARFTESYDRYSKLQKYGKHRKRDPVRDLVRAIMHRFAAHNTVAVELRPTLDLRRAECQKKLREVILGYFDYLKEHKTGSRKDDNPVLLGLVPSLFKQELSTRFRGATDWDEQARIWHRQLDALFAILDEVPALRYFVVGLDAAGRERGCPPRVLAPLFQRIRQYNQDYGLSYARPGRVMDAKRLLGLLGNGDSDSINAWEALNDCHVPRVRLGRTVHAGEDFADPMTGLRHIWETIELCDMSASDRIGHGLAAALAPEALLELLDRRRADHNERPGQHNDELVRETSGCYRVRKPRGEHLLDLHWLCRMTADNTSENARWCAELAHVAQHALGIPVNAKRLNDSLQEDSILPALPGLRYHGPEDVAAADCTWHIIDGAWLTTFDTMREHVLRELRLRRIVVESCPSSNLAVADMREPPAIELMLQGIACTIATDDPGLFASWPTDELAIVNHHAQKRRDTQDSQSTCSTRLDDNWLEQCLEQSRDACFVIPRTR